MKLAIRKSDSKANLIPQHSDAWASRPHASKAASIVIADNRSCGAAQRKLRQAVASSPRLAAQQRQLEGMFGTPALTNRSAPVQFLLTIDNATVSESQINRNGAYKTRLNSIISEEAGKAGFAPNRVRSKLTGMTRRGAHLFDSKREAVRETVRELQREAWQALISRRDIVYRTPPLTENDGKRILTQIEMGLGGSLAGLMQNGTFFPVPTADAARSHEWGLIKAKAHPNECMLAIGDPTGVDFKPFLNCSHGIAHSHPYFATGPPRSRYGGISLATKEIADHPTVPGGHSGIVPWIALATRANSDAVTEISKIFPSAADIRFSGEHHLSEHSVFTPYAMLRHPTGLLVANPNLGGGQFTGAPRLNFSIVDARKATDGLNYTCLLRALEGTTVIWSRNVTTNGTGQFGLLEWR